MHNGVISSVLVDGTPVLRAFVAIKDLLEKLRLVQTFMGTPVTGTDLGRHLWLATCYGERVGLVYTVTGASPGVGICSWHRLAEEQTYRGMCRWHKVLQGAFGAGI